jgi:hypothetical protein
MAGSLVKGLLDKGESKLRVCSSCAVEGLADPVVLALVVERRRGRASGRAALLATDGESMWAAELRSELHRPDNDVVRSLSEGEWLEAVAKTVERAEEAVTHPSQFDTRLFEAAKASSGVRMRIPSMDSPELVTVGGSRVSYLTTSLTLDACDPHHAKDCLRTLAGKRLALANTTTRSLRKDQASTRQSAERAVELAKGVEAVAREERSRLVAFAVGLVNEKKRRIVELEDKLRVTEHQNTEMGDAVQGMQLDLARSRLVQKRQRDDVVVEQHRETDSEPESLSSDVQSPPAKRVELADDEEVVIDHEDSTLGKQSSFEGLSPDVGFAPTVGASRRFRAAQRDSRQPSNTVPSAAAVAAALPKHDDGDFSEDSLS